MVEAIIWVSEGSFDTVDCVFEGLQHASDPWTTKILGKSGACTRW
jgi:hypothetical protein